MTILTPLCHHWTPRVDTPNRTAPNPYLNPGAFSENDSFSCFLCRKWLFWDVRFVGDILEENGQKRDFHENYIYFLIFLKTLGETWGVQNSEKPLKTVVSRKVSKNSHFHEKRQKWPFWISIWGLGRDFRRKVSFLMGPFWRVENGGFRLSGILGYWLYRKEAWRTVAGLSV